jgi:hypothetical protein
MTAGTKGSGGTALSEHSTERLTYHIAERALGPAGPANPDTGGPSCRASGWDNIIISMISLRKLRAFARPNCISTMTL